MKFQFSLLKSNLPNSEAVLTRKTSLVAILSIHIIQIKKDIFVENLHMNMHVKKYIKK